MGRLADYPILFTCGSFLVLLLAAWAGAWLRDSGDPARPRASLEDFGFVLPATLTLLGLIIGFSFSMALNRYDQRKNYEEAEANAIGTEYLRADLLPDAEADQTRRLLRGYLDLRVQFYITRDSDELARINERTALLQGQLWTVVRGPSLAQPNAIKVLVLAGMNDVLNSQGYTQSAWWNRIPTAAWVLMLVIAVCSNVMLGYGAHKQERRGVVLLIMPFLVSIALFLVADIDSPRGGVIRVSPQNLLALAPSLRGS